MPHYNYAIIKEPSHLTYKQSHQTRQAILAGYSSDQEMDLVYSNEHQSSWSPHEARPGTRLVYTNTMQ